MFMEEVVMQVVAHRCLQVVAHRCFLSLCSLLPTVVFISIHEFQTIH